MTKNYWKYTDAIGIERIGAMESFIYHGGTDVTS